MFIQSMVEHGASAELSPAFAQGYPPRRFSEYSPRRFSKYSPRRCFSEYLSIIPPEMGINATTRPGCPRFHMYRTGSVHVYGTMVHVQHMYCTRKWNPATSGIPNRGNCMESGPSSVQLPYGTWVELSYYGSTRSREKTARTTHIRAASSRMGL